MHLAFEDPADQLLHVRLCLLREPGLIQRPACPFHRARGRRADHRFLQAQLYRGAVPVLRDYPFARLHHGAARPCRPVAARGTRLSRLYPPQVDPRG